MEVKELYGGEIHGVTFTIVPRKIGAKVYKNTGVEIRISGKGFENKFHLEVSQLKQMLDNLSMVYKVAKIRQEVTSDEDSVWQGLPE